MSDQVFPNPGDSNGKPGDPSPYATPAEPKKSNKVPVIAAVTVGVLAVGGVAAVAGTRMFGGGAQPESVLPGDAIIYGRVDLDPSAAQKIGAFKLMQKYPKAKDALSANDPKKAVFEWLQSTDKDAKQIDYAKDIEPWLGDRMGFAMLAPTGSEAEPVPVIAMQVKDEEKAKAGIATLKEQSATTSSNSSMTPKKQDMAEFYKDGYVVITSKPQLQRVQDAVGKQTLAANDTFAGDMKALGDAGVASFWMDNKRSFELSKNASVPSGFEDFAAMSGRSVGTLRFASDYVEVASVTRGSTLKVQAPAAKDLTSLPGDTAAVFSLTGGKDYVKQMWDPILKAVKAAGADPAQELPKLEQQSGLKLPEDLETLLGDQLDLVVAKQDFRNLQGMPKVGMRLWTDTTKASSIVDKLQQLAANSGSGGLTLPKEARDGHLDLALTQDYLSTLKEKGNLGDNPGFATAVPELDKQASVLFVDLDAIEDQYLDQVPADQRDLVKSLKAIGVSSTPMQGDEQKSTMRLVVE